MNDLISRSHFDSRIRVAGGMVEEDLSDDFKDGVLTVLEMLKTERSVQRWIPIEERLPENDRYILMSFANAYMPQIGRYESDEDGGGAFYPDDDDRSCASYGLMVDAWMELPGCMDFPKKEN